MKQFASYISTFRQQHSAHLSHLPSLEEAYGSICAICATLRVGDSPQLKYLIKKIQCRYLLEQLVQVNKAVLESAKGGNFTVVEALSRIAIEHAVNIIYVAEDEAHARAQSLLHHHVDGCHSRATAWKKYAVESGDEEALSIADRKIEQLNGFAFHSQSTVGSVDKWPSARKRFKAIGFENLYHVLFASSSDSIHSLSEDIFNLTVIDSMPEALRKECYDGLLAEKSSFAIYLAINAILFFCQASLTIASIVTDGDEVARLKDVAKIIQGLLAEHEVLSKHYRES